MLRVSFMVFAAAMLAALIAAAGAGAHEGPAAPGPSGVATRDQTITGSAPARGFSFLRPAGGEPYVVRRELASPKPARERRRTSLTYFAQLTDFQLADEESPARVEFLDQFAGEMTGSAWRPQEATVVHAVEASIRQVNHFLRSTVPQGDGSRAAMDLAVMTGDLADNMQRNETEWVFRLLAGGTLNPGSGTRDLSGHPCTPESTRDYDDPSRYTGVQDYDDHQRNSSYYDPDEPFGPTFGDWPAYAGLMDRAQQPFQAEGLRVPSYVLFGNHDALAQGTEDAIRAYEDVATGCLKPLTGTSSDGLSGALDPTALERMLEENPSGVMQVPPDENRQYVDKRQFKDIFRAGQGDAHGFAYVDSTELAQSRGAASYYAWSPKPGLRFIALDTVADAGNIADAAAGNIDNPQYLWLKGELEQAQERDELVVVFGHHAIGSLTAESPDETAMPCTVDDEHGHDVNPGCDRDPRLSAPIRTGPAIRDLFLAHPAVIAYAAGHSHENRVQPFSRPTGGGFWEIKSPAIADWPPQHRLIEVMDNHDNTLSIFATMLDHDSPIRAPESGTPAGGMTTSTLASVGRTLTWNDPDQHPDASDGDRNDRNVELVLPKPRRGR